MIKSTENMVKEADSLQDGDKILNEVKIPIPEPKVLQISEMAEDLKTDLTVGLEDLALETILTETDLTEIRIDSSEMTSETNLCLK